MEIMISATFGVAAYFFYPAMNFLINYRFFCHHSCTFCQLWLLL